MVGGLWDKSRYFLAGASAIAILALGTPAKAQDIQSLEAQIKAMQVQMEALRREVQQAKSAAAAASSSKKDDLDLKVRWRGAPEFSSGDGKFKMKVRGRIHTDYNHINQDSRVTFTPDVSATQLRRARLGVEGVLFYDFKYILEVDFAGNSTAVRDAYLEYTGLPVNIRVGNYKTYNSLEHLTSSNNITFMERAAFIEAFGIDRQIGAGLSYAGDHFTVDAGIFGESVGSAPLFSCCVGDENIGFAARGTVAPINKDERVVHFGASVRTRDVGDDQPFLQYQARAANLGLSNRFVNTQRIGDYDTFWGLEGAVVYGPFSVQGEYGQLDADLPSGATIRNVSTSGAAGTPRIANPFLGIPDPSFSGWYIDGSVFLTGESRPYSKGVFGRVKVKNPVLWGKGKGGWGAWQIAARYDVLDLSDNAFNNAPNPTSNFVGGCAAPALGVNTITGATPIRLAQCGDQETWIIGVNWYLNDYVRLMFNYTESDLSGYPTTIVGANTQGIAPGTPVKGFDGATIRGFGMRAQVDW